MQALLRQRQSDRADEKWGDCLFDPNAGQSVDLKAFTHLESLKPHFGADVQAALDALLKASWKPGRVVQLVLQGLSLAAGSPAVSML